MNRILRDTVTLLDGTTAKVEITLPDQEAVTVHKGDAKVYVESTTRDKAYCVHLRKGRHIGCECEYFSARPRHWHSSPCVHVRCAKAVLSVRGAMAVGRGAQLGDLLKGLGWSEGKFRAEVKRCLTICGGDLYGAVTMLEGQTLGSYGYERAA